MQSQEMCIRDRLYIDQGMGEVVLPLLFAMSSLAVLFTSLFKTNSYLIGAKDYELLQALPIPAGTIVSCRLLVSYCIAVSYTHLYLAKIKKFSLV